MRNMREIVRAIINLENNQNWKMLLEQMQERKAGYERAIVRTKDETELRWHQGRLMELNDLLDGIINARIFMERLKAGEVHEKTVSGLNNPGP